MKESDLYTPVKTWLETLGYTVKGEVRHADIAAMRNDELLMVELKRGMTLQLLAQAVERQKQADFVYLAIPRPKRFWFSAQWRSLNHVLRRLELGLLLVDLGATPPTVECVLDAAPFDREASKQRNKTKRRATLREISRRGSADTSGGVRGQKIMTAYRLDNLALAHALGQLGEASLDEIRTHPIVSARGMEADRVTKLLYSNGLGWFERCGRGRYRLRVGVELTQPLEHQPDTGT